MAGTVEETDDFVVDMVLDVDPGSTGVEDLCRRIRLPGMEILRTTAHGTIWLSALVTASGEADAILQVQDRVLAQLPDRSRAVAAAVVSCVPLGELYARLDAVPSDEELNSIEMRDLVEEAMWDRPEAPGARQPVDLRATLIPDSA